MWKFYYRLARQLPVLIRSSTSTVQGITTVLITLGVAAGPWLAQYGQGDLAVLAEKVPGWWSAVPITLLVLYGLLKANFELHSKTQAERDTLATRQASGPKLGVVFDPKCEGCFNNGGLVSLGVWNSGPRAEDVHVYLSAVEPGPTTGKLELQWAGEGNVGRPINTTSRRGHHHAVLLVGNSGGYFFATNTASGALGMLAGVYSVEVSVEAGNSDPVIARVEIDCDREPPVLGVSLQPYGL